MPKLTARKVETLKEPGMHGDGEGLYLRVGPTLAKSWILRTVVHGRRRELGLGSASLFTLAEARETARKLRKVAREGGDPDTARKREALTFKDAALKVHEGLLPTWRSKGHGQRWLSSLEHYAFPHFGDRLIHTVNSADIMRALSPIWTDKHDTAKRVKQRIAAIFDWAKGAGHYPHENPVNGLKKALPTINIRPKHMPALPWQDLPDFMENLGLRDALSARTLEFTILTAARSKEARRARWSEIEGSVWTLPPERMKNGLQHRVPLSDEALEVLESVRGLDNELVFPSQKRAPNGSARPQSDVVFRALMNRMGVTSITTHGFRSTFRNWCGEYAKVDREISEKALSHSFGNKVERAYARSDLFERRRVLMDAWSRYAIGKTGSIVELVRA